MKAGKSSLLNALIFDGDPVLPKAATPMTAALTELSYGDSFSAEVSFFSDDDRKKIKAAYEEYKEKLARFTEKIQEARKKNPRGEGKSLPGNRKKKRMKKGRRKDRQNTK